MLLVFCFEHGTSHVRRVLVHVALPGNRIFEIGSSENVLEVLEKKKKHLGSLVQSLLRLFVVTLHLERNLHRGGTQPYIWSRLGAVYCQVTHRPYGRHIIFPNEDNEEIQDAPQHVCHINPTV